MATTHTTQVAAAIQTFWSPLFMDELRQQNLIVNLVNRDYEGAIEAEGDTVKITQVNKPTGQTLTRDGSGGDRTFTPAAMSLSSASVTANRRFVASFDIDESAMQQSMVDPTGPKATEVRKALVDSVSDQINAYIFSLVSPTTTVASTATMTAAVVVAAREAAGTAKWGKSKPWYALMAPNYWADCLIDDKLTSGDFVDDKPVVGGQSGMKRFGFNMFEDDSMTNEALFFHPDFLHFVAQYQPRFKISDKHAQGEFAFVLSVDILGGASLGIAGAGKHYKVKVAA